MKTPIIATLPTGQQNEPFQYTLPGFDTSKDMFVYGNVEVCEHEWVNVGFNFDKWVCKKCDQERGN